MVTIGPAQSHLRPLASAANQTSNVMLAEVQPAKQMASAGNSISPLEFKQLVERSMNSQANVSSASAQTVVDPAHTTRVALYYIARARKGEGAAEALKAARGVMNHGVPLDPSQVQEVVSALREVARDIPALRVQATSIADAIARQHLGEGGSTSPGTGGSGMLLNFPSQQTGRGLTSVTSESPVAA